MVETTIAERGQEAKRESVTRLPAAATAAFEAEIDRLVAVGVPVGMATVGSTMPDGDLLDPDGGPTSLTAVRDGRAAVVVFYRGVWCPYCNLTLRAYQETLVGELADRGWPWSRSARSGPTGR